MRYDILVGGTDGQYIRAFLGFLIDSKNNQFNITLADTTDKLLGFIAEDRYDLYLIEENFFPSISPALTSEFKKKLLVLAEASTLLDTRKISCVLKYQNVRHIEKCLISQLEDTSKKETVTKFGQKTLIVSFYSCIGGVGTTTLAQIFAQSKSAKGHKVLFLSLEDMPGYETFFHSSHTNNLSDYMVYLLTNTNWLHGLAAMVSVDSATGVHYFKPVVHNKDLYEFDDTCWQRWLAYVADRGDYAYIVIDLGRQLYTSGMQLLLMSHHKVYVTANDLVAASKWQLFLSQSELSDSKELFTNKTVVCYARSENKSSEGASYDVLVARDDELYKLDRQGQYHLNPQSAVFRQVEEFLGHV